MNEIDKLENMLDTNELNRLHRAAKNKDKNEIKKWGYLFEKVINDKYYELYKKQYVEWLSETFKDFDVAICYALHFNEQTRFGNKRLADFMEDLSETIRGFYRGDFNREDYKRQLKEDGVKFYDEEFLNNKLQKKGEK